MGRIGAEVARRALHGSDQASLVSTLVGRGQVFFSGELPLDCSTDKIGFLRPGPVCGRFQTPPQFAGKPHRNSYVFHNLCLTFYQVRLTQWVTTFTR